MMATTPDRQTVALSRLKSPRTPSSPGTVASLKVVNAVTNFVEFHRKWCQAVAKGLQFCNAIRNIKNNVFRSANNEVAYPENLILHCKNLIVMVSIMEDVIANAFYMVVQLKSLKESFENDYTIGRTWNFAQTVKTVEMSIVSYEKEITTRKYIAENIGHALSTEHLDLFVSCWNNTMDVERNRELYIHMMFYEFRLNE
ncbi:uncharacterized protein LOC131289593 [Anopheles ziemanni]|uniref:uncharacterized protein LOC131266027 n=1 Tax=Anopheles coustani TaxID=139045 RepID=UPI002658A9C3|nr:uncharacterized protein LOC131266027 [Anopheles coustani]XP_058174871.1 uncharacterized protein LOC131289593 [Anopheles ziemanni]